MEEVALTSHMKTKKHVESLMLQTPAPPLIILKISFSGVRSF